MCRICFKRNWRSRRTPKFQHFFECLKYNEIHSWNHSLWRANTASNRKLGGQPTLAIFKTPGCPLQSSMPGALLILDFFFPSSKYWNHSRTQCARPLGRPLMRAGIVKIYDNACWNFLLIVLTPVVSPPLIWELVFSFVFSEYLTYGNRILLTIFLRFDPNILLIMEYPRLFSGAVGTFPPTVYSLYHQNSRQSLSQLFDFSRGRGLRQPQTNSALYPGIRLQPVECLQHFLTILSSQRYADSQCAGTSCANHCMFDACRRFFVDR